MTFILYALLGVALILAVLRFFINDGRLNAAAIVALVLYTALRLQG